MSEKILLILDLDETLIHATPTRLAQVPDFQVYHYFLYARPGLTEFLQHCAQHFRLAIWSSASDDYVREIVQRIVPAGVALEFVWGRSRCTRFRLSLRDEQGFETFDHAQEYEFAKRLKKVRRRGFRLPQVLIVDDTPAKVLHNYGNAIYIRPYTGAPDDRDLTRLAAYLLTMKDAEDVRAIEKRGWLEPYL